MRGILSLWVEKAPLIIIMLYMLELILNRVIFRVIVFIPPGPVQEAFGRVIAVLGLAFLNASALAGIIALLTLIVLEERRLLKAAYATTLALLALNLAGLTGMHWALIIFAPLLATVRPERSLEALFLLLATLATLKPSATLHLVLNLAWLALPALYIIVINGFRIERAWIKRSLPAFIVALLFAARDPYIASQVLVFAMGLLNPWYLPPAILLYSATGSWGLIGILLTGPQIQLSFQPLILIALYGLEAYGRGRGEVL